MAESSYNDTICSEEEIKIISNIYYILYYLYYLVLYSSGNLHFITTCNTDLQKITCRESPDVMVEDLLMAWQANIRVARPSLTPNDLRYKLKGNPGKSTSKPVKLYYFSVHCMYTA